MLSTRVGQAPVRAAGRITADLSRDRDGHFPDLVRSSWVMDTSRRRA
jgi:hypothetical protein